MKFQRCGFFMPFSLGLTLGNLLTASYYMKLKPQACPEMMLKMNTKGTSDITTSPSAQVKAPTNTDTTSAPSSAMQMAALPSVGISTETLAPSLLELPDYTKGVIINVGSNIDPPLPPKNNKSIIVLAVEPILATAAMIPHDPRMFVLTCAIAGLPVRLQTMFNYGGNGVSSSLSKFIDQNTSATMGGSNWKSIGYKQYRQFVAVVTLEMLLNSIPANVDIVWLKTDMQGYDFQAIQSAGDTLRRRVHRLTTETYVRGTPGYEGSQNDLEKDWIPYMRNLGYALQNSDKMNGMIKRSTWSKQKFSLEFNAEWRAIGTPVKQTNG